MTTGRLAVLALAALLAFGGLGTAFALDGDDDGPGGAQPIELRKDDASAEVLTEEDDGDPEPTGDGDATRGDDGTGGGNNTGDGDRTRGNDGTRGGDNTGDGDATWGNDGTGGGDNSYVAPAAPAPAYGGGGDDSGGGGSASGGGDT